MSTPVVTEHAVGFAIRVVSLTPNQPTQILVDVQEEACQRGDQAPRFAPEEMITGLHLHTQLLDRAYFHRTSDLQNRAAL